MDERQANIDLAFRNGLKDYEVLPPPDVWTGIDSRLVRKERPFYLVRAAAFLAIAISLSVLAYRWAARNPDLMNSNLTALDEESVSPASKLIRNTDVRPQKPAIALKKIQSTPVAANIPSAQTAEPAGSRIAVRHAEILPESNIQIPGKNRDFSIIRHNFAKKEPLNPVPVIYSTGNLYQDYLYPQTAVINSPVIRERWSLSTLATPTYYGKISSANDQLSKDVAQSEQAIVTYSGGLAVAYKLNKRLSIQSGIFYSTLGQELDGVSSFAGFQKYDKTKGDNNFELLTTSGIVTANNPDVFLSASGNTSRLITNYNKDVFDPRKASLDYLNNNMRQSFSYLELPVFLRYKVIDRSFDVNLIGGMSYNLLVNNSVYTVVDGNRYNIGTTEGMNTFAISSSVGMGMEYNVSGKLSLNLEPTFRYYLNSFNNSVTGQFHPYSFGVFTGLSYKF
jgi:hypothetical protein